MSGNGENGNRVTLAKVAEYAAVSKSAASKVLLGGGGKTTKVGAETARRINQAAAALGYKPSFMGRALSKGKNYMVGVLVPSVDFLNFGYYREIIIGFAEAMQNDAYNVLLLFRSEDLAYMKVIDQRKVDGMLVLQSDLGTEHIDSVIGSGIPTVVVNKDISGRCGGNVGCVVPDHVGFMRGVVDDFMRNGCRKILAIHNFLRDDANACMYKAFNEMIEAHAALAMTGKTVVPELPGDAFRLQCAKLLGSGELWDGIFIDNSELADIFMEVAIHAGVYPGKDFCLITTNTSEGLFTERRGEFAFYCQQGHVMGNAAWRMFAGMFAGSQGDELVKIPYKRQLVNNQGIINLRKSIQ